MKSIKPPLFLLLFTSFFALNAQESKVIYLSGRGAANTVDWEFYCSDGMNSGEWSSIAVPSCWEQEGFGAYNYGHVPFKDRLKEEGHYKHTFRAEKQWKSSVVELRFEGVMSDARVLVNGTEAGPVHQGAFYPFSYDISDLLHYGELNTLEVFVKKFSDNASVNQAERKADYWIFGGIFRPVKLQIHPPVYIESIAIDARHTGAFHAELALNKEISAATVDVEFQDADGKSQGSFTSKLQKNASAFQIHENLNDIEAWSTEFPNLYTCSFTLKDKRGRIKYRIEKKIGFRTVEIREADGIYVNDVKVRLKGVNRHTFHPDYGRTSSKTLSIESIKLIKGMNMNAVRMSHYPPDSHFLDMCDSLGLYVLDELAGWQAPSYDSIVGRSLLKEMIQRDQNHPSIILWDNGNEGGWNEVYESDFAKLDIQGREVLHPWALHGKINTAHYIEYDYLTGDHFSPRKIFLPTEFLHGLYDGGHGAGLEDYWEQMRTDPLCAGGFLWVFADESVQRRDKGQLDSDGNHAPDGILGPYLEKEASYYTIRELWSPVYIEKKYPGWEFNGLLSVENRYHFTRLDQCRFNYRLEKAATPGGLPGQLIATGEINPPSIEPGGSGILEIPLSPRWQEANILQIEVYDPHDQLIYKMSMPLQTAAGLTEVLLKEDDRRDRPVVVSEDNATLLLEAGGVSVRIEKATGLLKEVRSNGNVLSLGNGPVFSTPAPAMLGMEHFEREGSRYVRISYNGGSKLEWIMHPSGLLDMKLSYRPERGRFYSMGASFDFPEEAMSKVNSLGRGPYRVWKNRMKGPQFGVWEKEYNNTITGFSGYEYPEFKGYHAEMYWARIRDRNDRSFTVYSRTDDVFLGLYTPEEAPYPANTVVNYTSGDLSFMRGIPAIGTKFLPCSKLGPQSAPYYYDGRRVEGGELIIELSFEF